MNEDLKSKVIDVIDSLIPKGQNSLGLREADMVYGINKAKEAVEKLFAEISTQDCISRQPVLDAIDEIESEVADGDGFQYEKWKQYFCDLPSAQPKWIPVKTRPMDEEERKYYLEELGWSLDDNEAVMFESLMPGDGQEVWVCSKSGNVWQDTCEVDEGIGLEENGDWMDIVAWMPFERPEPWKGGEDECMDV